MPHQKTKNIPKITALIVSILLILLSMTYYDAFVYDVLAYHIPFAALRINFFDFSILNLNPQLLARFKGFPSLWQYLLAPGLVFSAPRLLFIPNLFALAVFSYTVKKIFSIPWFVSVPSVFSFPIILFGFRSAYQDFFVGIVLFTGVLLLLASFNSLCLYRYSYLGALLLFVASQVKYQGIISSYLITAGLILVVLLKFMSTPKKIFLFILPLVLASTLTSIHPICNWLTYGNPVYPIRTTFFDGPESNYTSSPVYTENLGLFRVPMNHFSSATEIDWILRGVKPQYSIDSGHSQVQHGGLLDDRAFSGSGVNTDQGIVITGGTFGLTYTIYLFFFLLILTSCFRQKFFANNQLKISNTANINMILDLLIVYFFSLFSPQSHELRYYMILLFIPIFVVNYYYWLSHYRRLYLYLVCLAATASLVINFAQPLKTSIQSFYKSGSLQYAINFPVRDFPDPSDCLKPHSELPRDQLTACLLLQKR